MASQLGCDLCGAENAILMQTNIGNGDVIAIGASCVLVFLLTTADSIVSEMPAENATAYGAVLSPIVARLSAVVDRADAATMADDWDENPVTGDMHPIAVPAAAEAPGDADAPPPADDTESGKF